MALVQPATGYMDAGSRDDDDDALPPPSPVQPIMMKDWTKTSVSVSGLPDAQELPDALIVLWEVASCC